MKKYLAVFLIATQLFVGSFVFGQGVFEASSQQSSEASIAGSTDATTENSVQNSLQATTDNSTQNSSQATTDNSTQNSSQATTDSTTNNSSQASTDATSAGTTEGSVEFAIIGGIVLAVALTVGGIILTVKLASSSAGNVVMLQDQIYLAEGKEYRQLVKFFEVDETELIRINDQLVVSGYHVESDEAASAYVTELITRLVEESGKEFEHIEFL